MKISLLRAACFRYDNFVFQLIRQNNNNNNNDNNNNIYNGRSHHGWHILRDSKSYVLSNVLIHPCKTSIYFGTQIIDVLRCIRGIESSLIIITVIFFVDGKLLIILLILNLNYLNVYNKNHNIIKQCNDGQNKI